MTWMKFTKGEKWSLPCNGVMVKDGRNVCKNCHTPIYLVPRHSSIGDVIECPSCGWVEKRDNLRI